MIKKILRPLVPNKLIEFLKQNLGVPNQRSSFLRLKSLGFDPKYILDIGAYEGNWAEEVHSYFPSAKIMMIEGQTEKQILLNDKIKKNPLLSSRIALLGSEEREVEFNIYETASSVYKEDNETGAKIKKIMLELLDNVVSGTPFVSADLIKIDTQGYELEILKGGINTLKNAQVILLEVSFIDIYRDSPLASDILFFMKTNGFVLYDICSLMRRPFDKALFQSDFMFIKENHEFRNSKRWD